MKFMAVLVLCILMIAAPFVLAQSRASQQIKTGNGSQTEVTTTFTPGVLDTFPWEKLLAFLGCASFIQVLIVRWMIKPVVRGENDKQMEKMETRFPSKDAFTAHEKADSDFQSRVDRYMESHVPGPLLKDKY